MDIQLCQPQALKILRFGLKITRRGGNAGLSLFAFGFLKLSGALTSRFQVFLCNYDGLKKYYCCVLVCLCVCVYFVFLNEREDSLAISDSRSWGFKKNTLKITRLTIKPRELGNPTMMNTVS